jgi:ABC-type nitrate/sulfonate/bicarbonate transport system substrate-binding protein
MGWRLVCAVLVLLVGGCSPAPQPTELVEVRVALVPAYSTLPVHLAQQDGTFARHGLRVEAVDGQDITAFAAGLAQDRYDIAMSVPATVIAASARGLDVVVVSRLQRTTADQPGTVWITRDPGIDSIEQLRGKTVAVPALSGQISDSLIYLLQQRGVGRDEVRFVQLPFAAMADQLKAGRVDVAVAGVPFKTAMAADGARLHEDVVLEAVRDASGGTVDNSMTALLASSDRFATAHPEVIRAFRAALAEAVAYLDTHEAEELRLLQEWLGTPQTAQRSGGSVRYLDIAPEDLRPYVTIARAVGTIDRDVDVRELVWQDGP